MILWFTLFRVRIAISMRCSQNNFLNRFFLFFFIFLLYFIFPDLKLDKAILFRALDLQSWLVFSSCKNSFHTGESPHEFFSLEIEIDLIRALLFDELCHWILYQRGIFLMVIYNSNLIFKRFQWLSPPPKNMREVMRVKRVH